MQGLNPALVQRLPEWSFASACIVLFAPTIPDRDAAHAHAVLLRTVLGHLQHLQAPAVRLTDWEWSAAAVAAMADMTQAVAHLRITVYIDEPLTGEQLGELLQLRVHRLTVKTLELRSPGTPRLSVPGRC